MAIKNSTAFSKEQTGALAESVTGIINALTNTFQTEVQPIINQIKGEDIIGESETKEPLMATVAQLEQAMAVVTDKLDRMRKLLQLFAKLLVLLLIRTSLALTSSSSSCSS